MKGDFSRNTFDPRKHFTRVLMQQGRVQLDADWNEQVAVLLHYLQALAEDLIGPYGGPAGYILKDSATLWLDRHDNTHNATPPTMTTVPPPVERCGFRIGTPDGNNHNFPIGPGRYYVNGILCENEAADATYREQPNTSCDASEDLPAFPFLVYLDVWERHVTCIERPGIREVALDGPDTASRAEVVWQVKTEGLDGSWHLKDADANKAAFNRTNINSVWDEVVEVLHSPLRGKLAAKTKKPTEEEATDPCIAAAQAGYRGLENQLYRVEIHEGGAATKATFKWSRENGSVVAAWKGLEGKDTLLVSGVRDQACGFAPEQWVELTHDGLELCGLPGIMVKLTAVDGEKLKFNPDVVTDTGWKEGLKNPKVRRWDHRETAESTTTSFQNGAITVQEGQEILLEQGIWITFSGPEANKGETPNSYCTGDYWLITARTATGDLEWPNTKGADGKEKPDTLGPHGVEHHYAPLAVVESDNSVVDLRCMFKPCWDIPPSQEG